MYIHFRVTLQSHPGKSVTVELGLLTRWGLFAPKRATTKMVIPYWIPQILPVELLQHLLLILERQLRKLQSVVYKPSVLECSKFLLLCSRTLHQAQQRGTHASNPKAGQLAAKAAQQNVKGHPEPQQPERLVVRCPIIMRSFPTADL